MPKAKRFKVESPLDQSNYRNAEIEFISADIEGVPFCEHGPTILLERLRNGTPERFYACAVCRSKKDCSFYRSFDEEQKHPTKEGKIRKIKEIMKINRGVSHKNLYERLKQYRKLPNVKRYFCTECSTLVLSADEAKKHDESVDGRQHRVINGISNKQLREPSRLMKSLSNSKKESQHRFSQETLKILADHIIRKFAFDGVLCVGTPRLKEFLHNRPYRDQCKTFMLDIDYRYAQFSSPRFFAQFNMFNGYLFTPLGQKSLRRFFNETKKLAIIADPPFGGLIAPFVQTLAKLKAQFEEGVGNRRCELVIISPYFMEKKICSGVDGITMLDYKVKYDDENALASGDGSHIRVFTTLDPTEIELPSNLGYRYCDQCRCYVAQENRHCQLCKACTSKDGRPYIHCSKCGKCVKNRYKHCHKCNRCHKPLVNGRGCLVSKCQLCDEVGHVWVKCPKRNQTHNDAQVTSENRMDVGGISESGHKASRSHGAKQDALEMKKRKRMSLLKTKNAGKFKKLQDGNAMKRNVK